MSYKNVVMMAVIFMLAVVLITPAVSAADGSCTVPPDEYFLKDGPMNGQPEHEGPQLGIGAWAITEQQRFDGFTGGYHLGLTKKTFIPGRSHNEQELLAFAKDAYCYTMPDYPYRPNLTDEEYASLSPYYKPEPEPVENVVVVA